MGRKQREPSRAEWVAQWRASGLPARVFGEQHGLSASTLHQWSHRLGSSGVTSRSAVVRRKRSEPSFAELLRVRPSAAEDHRQALQIASVIEIVLRSGRVVRVHGEVDRDRLRAVLEVVEAC
jgi:transposase-like protein